MRLSSGGGTAFARGALLACLALLLGGCFDMEYQLSLRNDGSGTMRMQIVTDPALGGAFQGKSFTPGWTVRNFVREGRFYHEETQGFASVGALALRDESVRLQMSGAGAARQGTLEHQVMLGPADQAAAALLIGRTLTYRVQAPGRVTAAEPVSIAGIEIEPVLQGAGATWQIPLPMLLRAGGQPVRFRTRFSAAGSMLTDGQSRSTTTVGGGGQTPSAGPAGQPAATLKALAGEWVGSASSGAAFSWNIREDGTFESVSSSGRTSGKIDVVEGRLVWTNVAGASGRLILDDAGRVLRGSVGGSAVTFELREMPVGPPMASGTPGTVAPAISTPGGGEPRTASSLNKIMITVPGWIGPKDLVGHLQAMIPGGGGIKADYLAESFRQAAPDERHESFLWTGVIRDTFERGDLIGAVTQLRDYILTQTMYAANRGGGTVSIEAHSWGGVLSYLALRELQWDSRFVKSLASVRVNLDTFGSPVGYIEQDSAKQAPTSLVNAGLRTLLPLLDLEKAVTLDATKISWHNYLLVDDPIASTVRSLGNRNVVLERSADNAQYSSTGGATTPQAVLSIPVHSQYYLVRANIQAILRGRGAGRGAGPTSQSTSGETQQPASDSIPRVGSSLCRLFQELVDYERSYGTFRTAVTYAHTNVAEKFGWESRALTGIQDKAVLTKYGEIDLDWFLDLTQFTAAGVANVDIAYVVGKVGWSTIRYLGLTTEGKNFVLPYTGDPKESTTVSLVRQHKTFNDLWPAEFLKEQCQSEQIVSMVMTDTLVGGLIAYPIVAYRNGAYGPVGALDSIREFVLYEGGARVGRFHVTGLERSKSLGCFEPIVARGWPEFLTEARVEHGLVGLSAPTAPMEAVDAETRDDATVFVRVAASQVLSGQIPDARRTYVRLAPGGVPRVDTVRLLDLDGDGVMELIGRASALVVGSQDVYGAGQPMSSEVLVLGSLPKGRDATLVRAWVSVNSEYPSNNVTRLEGVVDVDGDGTGELIISWAHGETTKYAVYEYRQGMLREVFQGADVGC